MTAMQYAGKLIANREQEITIFDDEQRNLIVNFAFKLDDRAATEELVNGLAAALAEDDKEEANRLIHDIPPIEKLEVPNEKQREASYKQALQGCSGRDWISILKTLNQRKEERLAAGKKITALDERYLRGTEQELYGELSVVLGIEKENMHDYIQEQIAAL